MKHFSHFSFYIFSFLCLSLSTSVGLAVESAWVKTSTTGRLNYVPDAEGDRILDFSAAGYQGRGVEAIPHNVSTQITVNPVSGDDTASIQAAINAVSNLPIGANGFRGAVQLAPGSYDINSQLEIRASGVVLRGSGSGTNGTILHGRTVGAEGTNQRPLIRVYGSGGASNVGSTIGLTDKVVPAGATSFHVTNSSQFQPGDTVRVTRTTNSAWISDIGMDMIPPRPDGNPITQWSPIDYRHDRVVTRIEGDRVFVDAPLPTAIEQEYGGGNIRRYNWSGAIENIGIENLRAESDFDNDTDEDHAWEFISIGVNQTSSRAQNVWVRDIHGKYFGDSLVVANPGSKWVTVENVVHEDPKSIITGGRRYTYDLSGELGLVTNAQADEGRHDFVNNSTAPKGPNVFHNSIATNANSDTGPHQRWATGTLFDNITVQGDAINARNRGYFGSGHGWSGANMTVWNSTADTFRVQNPPTSQNWLVGSTGTIVEDTTFGPQPSGYYDSHGTPVTTGGVTSLYEAQMNDARDITSFDWGGEVGNWEDNLGWQQGVVPGIYTVSLRDYLIGDVDEFTFDGSNSVDDQPIDPAWEANILGSSGLPISGLDDVSGNKNIAFTIQHQLDAGERVISGSLAMSLIKSGGVLTSDFLRLFDTSPENKMTFTELGWDTQINNTDPFVGLVDLGSSLENLQTGQVNVHLNDDVGVDWAMYVISVATPVADAQEAAVTIASGEAIVDSSLGNVGSINVGDNFDGTLGIDVGGQLNVVGEYEQFSGGTLRFEVDNSASGSLSLQGQATLAGELEISLATGFSPVGGEIWLLLTSALNISGGFTSYDLPDLDSNLTWQILESPNAVVALVALAGDYNLDGVVDAADYTVGRDSLGSSSNLAADGDGNGVVDAADYTIWTSNFGNSLPNTATSVPEPSSFVGLAISLMLMKSRLQLR